MTRSSPRLLPRVATLFALACSGAPPAWEALVRAPESAESAGLLADVRALGLGS